MKNKPTGGSNSGKTTTKDRDETRFELPLDTTCDLAWRIALTHPQFTRMISGWMLSGPPSPAEEPDDLLLDAWEKAIRLARGFLLRQRLIVGLDAIVAAAEVKKMRARSTAALGVLNDPSLTATEKETLKVSFRRGCQLITGLKKGLDAEKRFQRVLPALIERGALFERGEKPEPLEYHQKEGFDLHALGVIREAWLKLPKEKLRKKYEKSGRYRRNKQGRPRNPKK